MTATRLHATAFDGRTSRPHKAELVITANTVRLKGDTINATAPLTALIISEPTGGGARTVTFPDGIYCEVHDRATLATALAAVGWQDSAVVRIQTRWRWAVGAVALILFATIGGYVYGLPWLAKNIAPRLPAKIAQTISKSALDTLDRTLLAPSALSAERQTALLARLNALRPHVDSPLTLHFRNGSRLGANAFALPSGDIVVFDALAELLNDDEVGAVLAHEAAHVIHHHGMQTLIQSTFVSFVVGAWFNDISSLATSVTALALETNYSREFEREADLTGTDLIRASGSAPEFLATALEAIDKDFRQNKNTKSGAAGIMMTHPDTAERTAAIRAR